ncbi:MAG: class I SAM-dependent rRNA methyltransferase [Candidatus Binatus sp.]|uniref:class I SAM-dependent rRNA methyltransferase n=1 Tax=Candidatus Binatus sp. TaxID=2811406 RepID=UPI0027270D2E|nr:class I SAM-dependent rRNA methyltransferase [Candidatus Binatus sp.]MDO8433123.1 class I SAM-dependent rRNA methyltransferase [Candidatus Binatus sp.]
MAGEVNQPLARVILKRGREGPVRGGNPWIFSQAIERIAPARPEAGALVSVHDANDALLGMGYCNPATTIAVRMLAWGETPDLRELIARRLKNALELRRRFIRGDTDSYRLINGDGDGLSGIVVDRYGGVLVIQLLTAGAERMREALIAELDAMLHPRAIIERSAGAVRRQEGLEDRVGLVSGESSDRMIAQAIATENGIRVHVDFEHGQKTGYFLDQRENRALAGSLAKDARVLDAYCYEGGFALAAVAGGARQIVAIDTSARAIGFARQNLELNTYAPDAVEFVHGEAPKFMAEMPNRFDLIVLDPPPLARTRGDVERAGRMYVELNTLAMRALAPGGRILTFSCSTHFRAEEFIRAVRYAASNAGRQMRLIAHLGPGADHPVLLGHAEGEYLTGLLLSEL